MTNSIESAQIRPSPENREFYDHWRTLGAVTVAASFGFPTLIFFSVGIFAPIWAEEFAWSFGSMMAGILIASVTILLLGPFVGRYIDTNGARKIAAFSLLAFGAGYMSLAFSTGSITQYYISWAIMSVAGVGATAISFTYIVNKAFYHRRGLALGIALSSSGISAMLVKPLAAVLISAVGWRETIIFIGLLPMVIGAPVLFFGAPSTVVSDVSGEVDDGVEPNLVAQSSVIDALRSRYFWILFIAFLFIAFGNGAPIPNLENVLATHQFEVVEIVAMTSSIGFALIVGRILGGWLIDQFWAPIVGFVMLICAATGCAILAQTGSSFAYAQSAVILISLAAGIEYDLLSFLVAKYFGPKRYGAIYSLIFGVFAISTGVGPFVLGWLYDIHGDYSVGLIVCAGLLAAAAIILLGLGPYPQQAIQTTAGK